MHFRKSGGFITALSIALICVGTPIASRAASAGQAVQSLAQPSAAGFGFYVLSLSWSPSYCDRRGAHADKTRCDVTPRPGFVVNGLWPQFKNGYPSVCSKDDARRVSDRVRQTIADIMPGDALINREWRTHGRCTGLSQSGYFQTVRKAFETVRMPMSFPRLGQSVRPPDVVSAFLNANPGLPRDGITVGCDSHDFVREVRICLTKSLKFRSCPEIQSSMCKLPRAAMPRR